MLHREIFRYPNYRNQMIKPDQPIQRIKYLYDRYDRLRWIDPTAELTTVHLHFQLLADHHPC